MRPLNDISCPIGSAKKSPIFGLFAIKSSSLKICPSFNSFVAVRVQYAKSIVAFSYS